MLRKQFRGFISYTDEEFNEIWDNAIFIIDTNILINFYKYKSRDTTKSLLYILKDLKENNRLWIPHQVALEYFFNYEKNMDLQNIGMKKLVDDLSGLKDNAISLINKGKSEHPYLDTENFQFYIKRMESLNKQLQKKYEKEIEKLPDSKKIKEDILELLDGIVGDPYSQEAINEIQKEGEIRYKENIPPGFKDMEDKDKQEFRTYGNIRYQQKYGDLIIWNQIIDKAKGEENQNHIIFITEEKKCDWWEMDGRSIKRPHPQLLQEFYNKTKKFFYMYRIDNFVENAKRYLDINVTDEQIKEVSYDIEGIRKYEDQKIKNFNIINLDNKVNIDTDKISNAILKAMESVELEKIRCKNYRLIKIDKLFKYLSRKERCIIKDQINESYDLELEPSIARFKYNNVINLAAKWSIPNMEEEYKRILNLLTSLDIEEREKANEIFKTLPTNCIDRASELLEGIESMQELIEHSNLSNDVNL